jgi:hypothetical protein
LRDYCASPPYKIDGPGVIRPPARQASIHSPGLDPSAQKPTGERAVPLLSVRNKLYHT